MKKLFYSFLPFALLFQAINAQPLLPSIGINSLPADSAPICPIPLYLGSFSSSGYQEGDTAHDFKLYSTTGDSFVLSSALAAGKPVLLVSSSYTCPVFRGKIPSINNVISTYGTQIQTAVIYCVEAHPTDTSPYFGYVNITSANTAAGILFPQPTTYGERKNMVDTLLANTNLAASVFIDGPCNNWWLNYGPAPNNAYLIDTNGIIVAKHAWYDAYPDQILCDIDSLLGISGNCTPGATTGNFSLSITSNDTIWGAPGGIYSAQAQLTNNDTSDVLVLIGRLQNNIPAGWTSYFCLGITCYNSSTDSVLALLPAGQSIYFGLDYHTAATAATGQVRVGFRNQNNFSNAYVRDFWCITTPTGVSQLSVGISPLYIYPDPVSTILNIQGGNMGDDEYVITDLIGRKIVSSKESTIDVHFLLPGIYFILRLNNSVAESIAQFVKD